MNTVRKEEKKRRRKKAANKRNGRMVNITQHCSIEIKYYIGTGFTYIAMEVFVRMQMQSV